MEMLTSDKNEPVSVNADIFNYPFREGLIHQAVVTLLSQMRSGNHAQKTRAEVRGGGRKPWKQKGTGRARAGTIRSPLWRGGGIVFAAKPRDYSLKINKKMYRRAMRSIFSELYRRGDLMVVSEIAPTSHKTKDFLSMMRQWSLDDALIITDDLTENLYLGMRNLFEFGLADPYSIDPVTLLTFKKVLVSQSALKQIEEQLQ